MDISNCAAKELKKCQCFSLRAEIMAVSLFTFDRVNWLMLEGIRENCWPHIVRLLYLVFFFVELICTHLVCFFSLT